MLSLTRFGVLGVLVAHLAFVDTSSVNGQCEQAKLLASDAGREDYFGALVAISGDVAVIGAAYNDDAGDGSGSAYVFRRVGGAWVQEQKLVASDAFEGDGFGRSVAVSGDMVIVTSIDDDNVIADAGSAYVFRWNGTSWVEQQKLLPSDPQFFGHFGWSLAMDGTIAAIGQIGDSFAGTSEAGAVYVFRWNGTSWQQEQKLIPFDSAPFQHFGTSVGVDGSVIVGGVGRAVYVFRWNGSTWTEEQKLTAPNPQSTDNFGISVAVDRNVLVVGDNTHEGAFVGSGLAYAYRFNGSSWGNEQRLNPPTEAPYRAFGQSVAVRDNTLLVGATGGGAPGPASGSVYVYNLKGTQWVEARELVPTDAIPVQGYGIAVSLRPDLAVVGAYSDDDACPGEPFCGSGSAYIYDINWCLNLVPAMSDWGLAVLGLSILAIGVVLIRRKPAPQPAGCPRSAALTRCSEEIGHENDACQTGHRDPSFDSSVEWGEQRGCPPTAPTADQTCGGRPPVV